MRECRIRMLANATQLVAMSDRQDFPAHPKSLRGINLVGVDAMDLNELGNMNH